MPFLLDVNVIIAILDPEHSHHPCALQWFEREGQTHWLIPNPGDLWTFVP